MSSRAASRRSGNYNAEIDESLFGGQGQHQQTRAVKSAGSNGRGTLGRSGNAVVKGAAGKESVVVSAAELRNMMALTGGLRGGSTGALSSTQQPASPATAATANGFGATASQRLPVTGTIASSPDAAARAAQRKAKMLRLERELAARPAALTESEFEEKEQRTRLLGHAKHAMDEEMDDVKHMNQMMLYAQCATIRDAQILEKQRMADALVAEEKRMDLAMEIERVRTLKLMEERDAARAEEQRLGAAVIITQIQEREQERIRQQEARDLEAQAMLARVQALEAQEEQERLARVAAGRQLLAQVTEANHAQARAKLKKKQEEIDEELRIQAYLRQKEAREAANEAELARVRAEKEKEIARLRAMQERAQDRQAAIDELRAKRYQETKDRQWRQQQIEQGQKREAMKRDISLAREAQRQEKSRRIAEQALQEREEYLRVLEWQNAQTEADRAKTDSAVKQAVHHRESIQAQMAQKEREKAEARARYLAEGAIFQQANARDREKLEKLKQEKLALMESMGVPVKYRAELAKKKLLVASIH